MVEEGRVGQGSNIGTVIISTDSKRTIQIFSTNSMFRDVSDLS